MVRWEFDFEVIAVSCLYNMSSYTPQAFRLHA